MSKGNSPNSEEEAESLLENNDEFLASTKGLCESALEQARNQLHLLLQRVDVERLGRRREFVRDFRNALENEITQRVILRLPRVESVFKFDASRKSALEDWDNTVHLLVLTPKLLKSIRDIGPKLDKEVTRQLKCLQWTRFQHTTTVVEIQQVTPKEILHGVCYGAMFHSFYAAPSQIWPSVQPPNPCFVIRQQHPDTNAGFERQVAAASVKR